MCALLFDAISSVFAWSVVSDLAVGLLGALVGGIITAWAMLRVQKRENDAALQRLEVENEAAKRRVRMQEQAKVCGDLANLIIRWKPYLPEDELFEQFKERLDEWHDQDAELQRHLRNLKIWLPEASRDRVGGHLMFVRMTLDSPAGQSVELYMHSKAGTEEHHRLRQLSTAVIEYKRAVEHALIGLPLEGEEVFLRELNRAHDGFKANMDEFEEGGSTREGG